LQADTAHPASERQSGVQLVKNTLFEIGKMESSHSLPSISRLGYKETLSQPTGSEADVLVRSSAASRGWAQPIPSFLCDLLRAGTLQIIRTQFARLPIAWPGLSRSCECHPNDAPVLVFRPRSPRVAGAESKLSCFAGVSPLACLTGRR